MKTRITLLISFLCVATLAGWAADKKGNGKIVTRNISISDYDVMNISSKGINVISGGFFGNKKGGEDDINYTQRSGGAKLEVTIDENLFADLDIKTVNGKLLIQVKEGSSINPTHFVVNTSSKSLKAVSKLGSLDLNIKNSLIGDDLWLDLTGSGDVTSGSSLQMKSVKVEMKGSGDVILRGLDIDRLEASLLGSGDISLSGKANKGIYRVSGSGDIEAFGCEVKDLVCSVAGSGDIDATATGTLDASVSGSGDIEYKGGASVKSHVAGSGAIEKVR